MDIKEKNNQKPIRIGLLGAGTWAIMAHVEILSRLPQYELTAVYARRVEVANQVAKDHSFRYVVNSVEELVNHPEVDLIVITMCREERFLAAEKHLLGPLPETTFEVKYYCEPKVANNNHIYIGRDKHYYSVPFTYVGSHVKVIYTRSMVYIYARGKQVAVHIRSYQPAGYTTVKEHLNSHHRHYMDRSPAYYIEKAREKSPELHLLVQLLFEQPRHPEQLYRTCDGLLRLEKKAPAAAFAKACELAIEYRNFSYRFVGRILQNNMEDHQDLPAKEQSLPIHGNIRGKEYYTQTTIQF